jgi:hypothetical protein
MLISKGAIPSPAVLYILFQRTFPRYLGFQALDGFDMTLPFRSTYKRPGICDQWSCCAKIICQIFLESSAVIIPGNSDDDTLIGRMVLDNRGGHLRAQKAISLIFEIAGDDGHFFPAACAIAKLSHLPVLGKWNGFDFY